MSLKEWEGVDLMPHPAQAPQPRTKPMQVLCLGLSRTGTMSTYIALNKLGYNCYHFLEAARDNQNNRSVKKWRRAVEAKYFNGPGKKWKTAEDFDELLWRYDAVSDMPCCLFADGLLSAYPDAKVILTDRDVESWIGSMDHSFYALLNLRIQRFIGLVDWEYTHDYLPIVRACLKIWTKDRTSDRESLRLGYLEHVAYIKSVVPNEKLLVFHPKEGWEPLCKFLGKEIPKGPFPKVNEGDVAARLHRGLLAYLRLFFVLMRVLKVIAPVAIVGLAWWIFTRWQ